MTKILRLSLHGFKSFANKTDIIFGDKYNCILGPNGSGKSTLANTIMGHPNYKVTKGKILLTKNKKTSDITFWSADKRANAGVFLSFQYPSEVPGVNINSFLRTAVNAQRENNKLKPYTIPEFFKLLKEKMKLLGLDASFRKRSLNEGFSGGEKKRSEMLQLLLLKPTFAILDETDSGLDVDGIKAVADAIHTARKQDATESKSKTSGMGIVLITHYERFIKELMPDKVSILCGGKIITQGSTELAKKIHEKGFDQFIKGK